MIQNRNQRSQFQPAPYVRTVEPVMAGPDPRGIPGLPFQQTQQSQQWQPAQQTRPSRFPVESIDTRSIWAAHPQEVPLPPLQSTPSRGMEQVVTTPPRASRPSPRLWWRDKKRLGLLAAVGLVLICCLIAFTAWRAAASSIANVTLYRVSTKSVDLPIGGGGIAYPVQRLDISYPFTAHVLSVFVKPGDRVKPNQSLVQIDLSQVNGEKLSTLQAQVAQAYQDMLAAQSYYYSVLKLGNPIVIAQAQQQYTTSQVRYDTLVSEEQAPELHQGNILSPIMGVVTAVNVYPDQLISANRIMLTIFDESSIIVRVQIPLSNYNQIQINQRAQAVPSALPGRVFNGSVISIIPNANPQSGTFEVWVLVPKTNGSLLPGSNVYVRVQDTVNALVVPRLAVLNPDLDSSVFVVRQQHAHLQHVQVSGYAGDEVLISSGLSVNDLVVLVGLDSLQDGQTVRIQSIES